MLDEELQENDIIKCKFENCDFEHNDLQDMLEHLEECPKKPEQVRFCPKDSFLRTDNFSKTCNFFSEKYIFQNYTKSFSCCSKYK